jgi:hypothetical protein
VANLAWTYDDLFAALQAWPTDEDDAYLENLPTIIGLGELRLVRDLNLDVFDRTDTSQSTVIGTREIDKPTGCVVLREVGFVDPVLGYQALEKRSLTYCKFYAPDPAAVDVPVYWSELSETQILIVPTPDAIYPVHQYAVTRPDDSLSLANQGPSYLSSVCPDALFAACLMEAEQFVKADDRYADYKSKYYEELLPIARLELRQSIRSGDRTPMKAGPVTQ